MTDQVIYLRARMKECRCRGALRSDIARGYLASNQCAQLPRGVQVGHNGFLAQQRVDAQRVSRLDVILGDPLARRKKRPNSASRAIASWTRISKS